MSQANKTAGTGTSTVVSHCQVCENTDLKTVLFLGFLPPVNKMQKIGDAPREQSSYPAPLLYCPRCALVQLGLIVDPEILFPKEYPYTSSTTKVLRENFAELASECKSILPLSEKDLVVDIGSNDGNLLRNFKGTTRALGITPEDIGQLAVKEGIPTLFSYFNAGVVPKILEQYGKAKVVTATNVFAHIEHVHDVITSVLKILEPNGMFITESHYLLPLVETLQYDTIYHEHLRYYSVKSLKYLFDMHGLEIVHTKRIPTHGGSVRVYAARKGQYPVKESVSQLLKAEDKFGLEFEDLLKFKDRTVTSKLDLMALLRDLKKQGKKIYGISAPSRASTLINYVGIDDGIVDYVLEVDGSYKVGKYVPGTLIPIVNEKRLFEDQPDYALLFSWHIAEELMPKLTQKGFKGKYIIPLPHPTVYPS